jgi:hypothetical protein
MKTDYTVGFQAGIRHEREHVEHFITHHLDSNVALTAEDVLLEIQGRDRKDMETQLQEIRKGQENGNK